MVKVPGARLLIGRAAVRSESVGVEGPAWWVKHFKPVLNWWIWDPTHSSTLHPLYLTLCIPYCPHLPHSDLSLMGVTWLTVSPDSPHCPNKTFSVCLCVCAYVSVCCCLCAAHWAASLLEWCWDETQRRRQTRQPLACLPPAPLHDSSFSSRSLVLML